MNIEKLTKIADRVDAKGLHSIADQIDQVVSEFIPEVERVECDIKQLKDLIAEYRNPLRKLIRVADRLDERGLRLYADKLDRMIELEALRTQSAIDVILHVYKNKHKAANFKGFCKTAIVRKDNLEPKSGCPFGLSIPGGCKNAGGLIFDMEADEEEFEKNKLLLQKYNPQHKCPFAKDIIEDKGAVNCAYGTPLAELDIPQLYRGSPIYPKLWEGFNTLNLDRSYYQFHDFSYPSFYG